MNTQENQIENLDYGDEEAADEEEEFELEDEEMNEEDEYNTIDDEEEFAEDDLSVKSKSAYLIDADTCTVIYAENENNKLAILASFIKLSGNLVISLQ